MHVLYCVIPFYYIIVHIVVHMDHMGGLFATKVGILAHHRVLVLLIARASFGSRPQPRLGATAVPWDRVFLGCLTHDVPMDQDINSDTFILGTHDVPKILVRSVPFESGTSEPQNKHFTGPRE